MAFWADNSPGPDCDTVERPYSIAINLHKQVS
jgi:hypothetical protein